jgi:hypothetical protein
VQLHNLHMVAGESRQFSVFVPPVDQPFALVEVDAEVRILDRSARANSAPLEVGGALATLSATELIC